MSTTDKRNRRALRAMAWERAKGELKSMLHTYYPEYDSSNNKIENGFDDIDAKIEEFIDYVESNHIA